jgi:uncharacterized cupredoxin-like copper-binding protein
MPVNRSQMLAAVLAIAAAPSMALAGPVPAEAGSPGRAADARRTVEVVMRDNSFEPQAIQVRPGETVRFRVVNRGQLLHEFNIGTPAMHEAHRREMLAMMQAGHMTATSVMAGHGAGHGGMAHDDPNSVLLEPGKNGEVIWRFPQGGTLEISCNVPGHSESGMVGQVRFGR